MRRFLLVLTLLALAILVWPSSASASVCAPRIGHGAILHLLRNRPMVQRLRERPVLRAAAHVATAPVRFFRRCR